jgi:serine/threonine protein kinase
MLASSLKNEAAVIKDLGSNNNVVKFVDFHEFPNMFILAIEYIAGGTLQDFLRTKQRKNEEVTEAIASQIMRGIF